MISSHNFYRICSYVIWFIFAWNNEKLLKDLHNFYEKDVIKMMTTIFSPYHVMIA